MAEIASGQPPPVLLPRSQALLSYLVLHRHTPQPRQRIAFHLWSESTDEQARANLRKELSRLRHALPNPDEFLRVDTKTLQWLPNGNFTLDVAKFEAGVKVADPATDKNAIQTQLTQALELYRGDLLPDLDDEWVVAERERLHQIHIRALERLIALLKEQQDYQTALTYAQHLLRVNDLNEAAYVTLMRLHGLNGDRAKALQVYHQCMTMLREELGIDPSTSTRKLYEQLLQEDDVTDERSRRDANHRSSFWSRLSPPPSPAHLAQSPLVGREQAWASIQRWANAVLRQEHRATMGNAAIDAEFTVLLLVGEPGIGKTRLLEELQAFAQSNRTQILWGRGFASEMMRPYGIWTDALRSAAMVKAQLPGALVVGTAVPQGLKDIASTVNFPSALGFLLPELGQLSPPPPDLSHLFDGVVQLLMQWANQAPLLILLDDIQWIDEASSAMLHYAMRLLRPLPVLFALAARAQELTENAAISRVVHALRREQRLQTLELPALDREQTADLIRSTHAIAPSELSLAVVNQVFIDSGGNPLFALEIARSRGQHQPSHANTVEALIGDRLHQLDDATREVLAWAAALGRSFKASTVAKVADYPVTQLITAIAQLERQAIIRSSTALDDEIGYDFAHDIVRQVVYQQISEPRRQLLHRQIASKLHEQATPDQALASDIAYHAARGGDRALATSAALSAAQRCLKLFAYAEALELAQQGIQQCQFLDPPNRILFHASLLRVQALAGVTGDRATQIEHEGQQLIRESKSLGINEAEVIAIEALIILQFDRSDFAGVHQQTLRALEASQMTSPSVTARVLAYSGSCLAEIGRNLIRAEALLLEAQSLASRVGLELCDIFAGLGCVHRHHGRYEEARSQLKQALRLTQAQQDHWRECNVLRYLAKIELETGDLVAALSYCDEISSIAAKIQGEGSEAAVASALAALARYRLGQPNAEIALTETIATLQQVDAKRMLAYVLTGAAAVDLERDRPTLAVNRAEVALKNAQIVNHPSEIALSWAVLIQGLLTLGEQQQATDRLELLQQTIKHDDLSILAQSAVKRAIQQMQAGVASQCKSPKQP